MKFSTLALIQSTTLGFLATANAQIFSNTSSVEPSATPSTPATALDVADINIVNGLTGNKDSYDRYGPFVFTVDLDASETGSVWFAPPAEFGGFPETIEFDYGTVSNDDGNFTVEFTSVPDSGAATLEFVASLTEAGIAAIPSPDTVTYTSDSSSGAFTDSINFLALPSSPSKFVGLINGELYYSINVPADSFTGSLSVASSSEDGYSFDTAYTGIYFVSSSPFNNGSLSAASGINESDDSSIIVSFDGTFPEGAVSVRVVYKATISGSADSYSNTAALTLPSLPLTKRDVTIIFVDTIYVNGPLAGTVVSSSSTSTDGSSSSVSGSSSATGSTSTTTSGASSATGSTSGSATATSGASSGSVATATVTDLSTTVITTCPTCAAGHQTTNVYVSTVTATASGIVTEYTTYCPLTTISKAKSHEGTVATCSVDIEEVTSGVYTVKTTYLPVSYEKSTAYTKIYTKDSGEVTTEYVTDVTEVTIPATAATAATAATGATGAGAGTTVAAVAPSAGASSGVTTIKVSTQVGVSTYAGAAANVQAGLITVLMAVAAFVL